MNVKRTCCGWQPALERLEPLDGDGNSLGIVYFQPLAPPQAAGRTWHRDHRRTAAPTPPRGKVLTLSTLILAISVSAVLLFWLGGSVLSHWPVPIN